MRTIRVSLERTEGRRDRRYARPPLVMHLGDAECSTTDWSLGGVRVSGLAVAFALGAVVTGRFRIEGGGAETVEFTGEVVRAEANGDVAFRFVELGERGFDLLDRAAARRFAGRK